jgi:hypothetical protein
MSTLRYIKNSQIKNYDNPVGEYYIAGVRIYTKDPLPSTVNLRECISSVLERMPRSLYSNVKSIMVGSYPFLDKREVDATYKDGTIYLTNKNEDNYDLISDLVHEIAHAFEEKNTLYLYEDKEIQNEFLSKREMLLNLLNAHSLVVYPVSEKDFYRLEYDSKFDNFLYRTVGYEKIALISNDIFISPYAATCLREYFANAFENFFINDIFLVQRYAPTIYKKLLQYLEF